MKELSEVIIKFKRGSFIKYLCENPKQGQYSHTFFIKCLYYVVIPNLVTNALRYLFFTQNMGNIAS